MILAIFAEFDRQKKETGHISVPEVLRLLRPTFPDLNLHLIDILTGPQAEAMKARAEAELKGEPLPPPLPKTPKPPRIPKAKKDDGQPIPPTPDRATGRTGERGPGPGGRPADPAEETLSAATEVNWSKTVPTPPVRPGDEVGPADSNYRVLRRMRDVMAFAADTGLLPNHDGTWTQCSASLRVRAAGWATETASRIRDLYGLESDRLSDTDREVAQEFARQMMLRQYGIDPSNVVDGPVDDFGEGGNRGPVN